MRPRTNRRRQVRNLPRSAELGVLATFPRRIRATLCRCYARHGARREPVSDPLRQKAMTTLHTILGRHRRVGLVIGAIAVAALATACGSDEPAGTSLPEPVVQTPVDEPSPSDGDVIGTANMNGTVVDPKPHTIDEYAIAESYPEQIQITFTSGDPNCTAADAQAVADGDTVRIELVVGITENAMATSCQAGDFEHHMSIPLTEGLDGRTVSIGV